LDRLTQVSGGTGKPSFFYPKGDADNGEFVLYPKPYRVSGIPYGMQLRYYCDLMRLDLAGTLMATLYRRWRNIFVQGVYIKALQDDDDDRFEKEERRYKMLLTNLISQETYGMDLSSLQTKVER
jgi:hypothetical protein